MSTSHDEELAREGAALQLPGQAPRLELGHDQGQNGHVGPVLGHQAGCAPRPSIADDQPSLQSRIAEAGRYAHGCRKQKNPQVTLPKIHDAREAC